MGKHVRKNMQTWSTAWKQYSVGTEMMCSRHIEITGKNARSMMLTKRHRVQQERRHRDSVLRKAHRKKPA